MEIDGAPVTVLVASAAAGAALGSTTGAATAVVPAAVTVEEIAAEVPDIVEMTDTRLSGRCPLKAQEWDTGGRGRGSRRRCRADAVLTAGDRADVTAEERGEDAGETEGDAGGA